MTKNNNIDNIAHSLGKFTKINTSMKRLFISEVRHCIASIICRYVHSMSHMGSFSQIQKRKGLNSMCMFLFLGFTQLDLPLAILREIRLLTMVLFSVHIGGVCYPFSQYNFWFPNSKRWYRCIDCG